MPIFTLSLKVSAMGSADWEVVFVQDTVWTPCRKPDTEHLGNLFPSNFWAICCLLILWWFVVGIFLGILWFAIHISQGFIGGKSIPEADSLAQARRYVAWKSYLTILSQRNASDEEQIKYPSILANTDDHDDHLDDEVKRVEEVELLWKVPGQARQPGGSPRIHLHSGTWFHLNAHLV